MKIIDLNYNEYFYINSSNYLTKELLLEFNNSIVKHNDKYTLRISEEKADLFRDLFGEQLQVVGFDDKYNLTKEGEILEDLVDKFFIEPNIES